MKAPSPIRPLLQIALLAVALGCSRTSADNPLPEGYVERATPAAAEVPAADWPRWRGVNYDGVSLETGWDASLKGGNPPQLWTAEIGTGFSGIAVAAGRAYSMGHRDGKDTVYCLDAATGREVWTHSYPCAIVDNLHEGGPACTPTVDGDRVYTVSKEGHFFALDAAKGSVVWEVRLQAELGVKMPDWGFSCSPLVWGETLIVEAGRTAAFDKRDGKLLWKSAAFRPGYGSPVPFKPGGETLIAALNNDNLLVVRADDGREVARADWETQYATTSTTPIVLAETIFISSGYGQGCALFKLEGGKLTTVYDGKQMRNHFNNSVLHRGTLYGIDGNSSNARACQLVAMDYATGKTHWKERGFGCGSLLVAGGKLIILSDEGELTTAEAMPAEYQKIATATILDGRCWTVPTLSHGRLYARNANGKLVCVDLRK